MEQALEKMEGAGTAGGGTGPKLCTTCRLAHVSCDRKQPCGRCVRLGKAESCQPPPTCKRGRPPRKVRSPDYQQQHQQQPQWQTEKPSVPHPPKPRKRACVRPTTTTADDTCRRPSHEPGTTLPPQPQLCARTTANSASPSTTTYACSTLPYSLSSSSSPLPSPSSSSPEGGCASTWSSLTGHQRFASAAGQQDSQEEGLRSLLGLVVDQVIEMRRENERLHDTIAQLRATQSESECRLARVEQDQQITSRQLEQTRIELEQTCMTLSKKIDDHITAAHPCSPPPQCYSGSQPAQPRGCAGLPAEAMVVDPTTPGADVERFIAQTLPFLRAFDYSSLILRDLRRPFVVLHMEEAETLDDMATPVIAYASPSMCHLLGYGTYEMYGCPITSFSVLDPETVPTYVRARLMRSPTPVGEPIYVSCNFITQQGRGVRVRAQHQLLYSQRRLAKWHIVQVERVLATDLGLAPLIKPTFNVGHGNPRKRTCSIVHEPSIRANLLTRLPHSLLFGQRGELTTTAPQPHSFGNHHCSGTAE